VKRPTRAKVGYQVYTIGWLDESEWEAAGLPDNTNGATRPSHGIIAIRLGFNRSEEWYRETLVHELLHACFAVSRIDVYMDDKVLDAEELVCNTQAPMLLALFRENPKVLRYLTGE
jgi:hypothetical protein